MTAVAHAVAPTKPSKDPVYSGRRFTHDRTLFDARARHTVPLNY
jgi:hypothetical protein